MEENKVHLSLYLMKEGTSVEDTISDTQNAKRHGLSDEALDGVLFLKSKKGDIPWWIDFLNPISEDDITARSSRTTSAVLALSVPRDDSTFRILCFTFGHGRHLLDRSKIERSFGLKVALNSLDPEKLRSFDTRRQNDIIVNARIQSSTATSIDTFNINTYQDILTKAVGSTDIGQVEKLGTFVRGSDGISFDVPIDPKHLSKRASQLLDIYESKAYQQTFPFVDHVMPVDVERSQQLDELLDREIKDFLSDSDSTFRCLYLAPPKVIDFEGLDGFAFSSEREEERIFEPEVSLWRYLQSRQLKPAGISVK